MLYMQQNEIYKTLLVKLNKIYTKIGNGLYEELVDIPFDYLADDGILEYQRKLFEVKLISFTLLKIKLENIKAEHFEATLNDFLGAISSEIYDEAINKMFFPDTNEYLMLFFDKLRVY